MLPSIVPSRLMVYFRLVLSKCVFPLILMLHFRLVQIYRCGINLTRVMCIFLKEKQKISNVEESQELDQIIKESNQEGSMKKKKPC